MPVRNTQPPEVIPTRSTIREVGDDGYGSERSEGPAAAVDQREVRAVRVGAHGDGDPAGGGGAVEGGPLDGGACVPGRQAGRVGRTGGVGARPARAKPGTVRAGRGAGGTGAVAGHGGRAGRGHPPGRGKSALGLTAGPVPPRVDAHVKAGLLALVEDAVEVGWSARRAPARVGGAEPQRGGWVCLLGA